MTKMTISYLGNLRCGATHESSGVQLVTDAPIDNKGRGESFSPTDLLCTSLGSCMVTLMGITAQSLKVPLGDVKVEITKTMASNPRRVKKIDLTLRISGDLTKEEREKIEQAAINCPVAMSIHPDIEQDVKFEYRT